MGDAVDICEAMADEWDGQTTNTGSLEIRSLKADKTISLAYK